MSSSQTFEDKRKHTRYITDARIDFRMPYDFSAEVDFKITDEVVEGRGKTYTGYSKNISVHGLAFESAKHLTTGDFLWMELHIPRTDKVIAMQGEVCWCRSAQHILDGKPAFEAGVEIVKVEDMDVEKTVYFDKTYGVEWSELLERVLGGFAKVNRKDN